MDDHVKPKRWQNVVIWIVIILVLLVKCLSSPQEEFLEMLRIVIPLSAFLYLFGRWKRKQS